MNSIHPTVKKKLQYDLACGGISVEVSSTKEALDGFQRVSDIVGIPLNVGRKCDGILNPDNSHQYGNFFAVMKYTPDQVGGIQSKPKSQMLDFFLDRYQAPYIITYTMQEFNDLCDDVGSDD